MYQIQASHFLASHFGNMMASGKNLDKLYAYLEWLIKQERTTRATINKMEAAMKARAEEERITYDGDMFNQAKPLM